jgi:hypothetical protein
MTRASPARRDDELRDSEAMFVWIERTEIDTMVEIGVAAERGIPIFVAFADANLAAGRGHTILELAEVVVVTPSAVTAWKLFLQWFANYQREYLGRHESAA